jgi:hypothetical protein
MGRPSLLTVNMSASSLNAASISAKSERGNTGVPRLRTLSEYTA